MEFETANYGWAQDAFLALDNPDQQFSMAPSSFASTQTVAPSAFSMPSTISPNVEERFGQITPPEELSPPTASESLLDSSLPVEPWPQQQKMQSMPMQQLPHVDPALQQQMPKSETQTPAPGRGLKRRRTTRQDTANQSEDTPASQQQQMPSPPQDPQPPKRKRGRPKLNPQPAESMSADGYPFPVSSARQSHLEKNRVAAHKCRQRRKEYINGLETKARENANKNAMLKEIVGSLREEVLELKNVLLRHAGCGCWAIDEYLQQQAGDLLGVRNPLLTNRMSTSFGQKLPFSASQLKPEHSPDMRAASTSLELTDMDSQDMDDDFNAMDMLNSLEDDEGSHP